MKEPVANMYFVAIVLPQRLNEKIRSYKNFMLERFACSVGLKSPAHITMIPPFWMEVEKENGFLNAVDFLSNSFYPFSIVTNNFSAFRPRTIFIDVKPNEQLNRIKLLTDHFFKQRPEYKTKIDNRPFHPHITIATRDLHKKSFYDAWAFFENGNFSEEWTAEDISVLRHNKRNWDVIHTSAFRGKPPTEV
ncbi:MAG TPA: 2'-5' RNA ligase family protein [Flavisolibacter sp.]|nr:2'-5' RNA ligase family protein [Flavisolibacter sp.]